VDFCGKTTSRPGRVKLILVNLSAMNADLLRVAFAGHEQIEVAGSAANAAELALLLQDNPDVALVASTAARKESVALPFLDQIAAASSFVRPIVISEDMDREDIVSFFYHGARGLVCKARTDFSVLLKCILCVSAGQVWADSRQLELLLCSLGQPRSLRVTNAMGDALLSQREEQVLHLLARGLSNRDLARTLKLSEHTVKNHLFRIFDKLGVSNRMEAVLCAMSRHPEATPVEKTGPEISMETGAA